MRFFFIIVLFSFVGFSQTNEAVINQAVQTAKSKNITTKSQAVKALEASGMTENQARQLARQRGLSYDQLLNQYFTEDTVKINDLSNDGDPDTSILKTNEVDELEKNLKNDSDEIDFKIKGQTSKYFGYDIFDNNPYLDKEYLLGNIDEGYLISPGDEIRIITYGDNSLEVKVKVDRNGNINIPDFGLFFASGMTFKTLKSRLKIFLGKFLSGLVSQPQKTFMDVSLTELKPTKVVVLGQVESPGPHILTTSGSSLSALYAAGGVKFSGSLREISIFRNNKLLKKIDLYDYITTGRLIDDVKLTNNDIIFVPTRKNSIELKGELQISAIFEIKENEDLTTLVKYSGGILPTTQTKKVNIQRIIPADQRSPDIIYDRKLITIDYQKLTSEDKKISLQDGDQITFFRISDLQFDQVTISGHVWEPGTYSLKTFPTLKSLIFEAAKGFMPNVYFEKIDVFSLVDGVEKLNTYSLSEIMSSDYDIKLIDADTVIVYDNTSVEGEKYIYFTGLGTQGSSEHIWRENYSLYDFIFKNTQINNPEFTVNILESRIDLKRYDLETGLYNTINYNFNNLDQLKNSFLLPRDKVILYSNSTIENIEKEVSIVGFVKNPKSVNLEQKMYPEDLIMLAGGFLLPANQDQITVSRIEINYEEERVVRKFEVSLDKDYLIGISNNPPKHNFILQDKDIISVKSKLGYSEPITLSIRGEVNYESNIVLEFKNNSFEDILRASGGLTKDANLKASTLTRDGNIVALDLDKIRAKDKIFTDGDEIFIASNKGLVFTKGAIENESTFIWKNGSKAKYFIKNSGGKLKESGNSYIILPNGKTKKIGFLKNPDVLPNSTIVVNTKTKKERTEGKFFDDFSTIFAAISSTLTTILLVNRL